MLRRKLTLLAASVSIMVLASTVLTAIAFSQDLRDFSFRNESSAEVDAVWIAESGSSSWGEQVLNYVIERGETRPISFSGGGGCEWDVHATGTDGGSWELLNVNLCATFYLVLTDSHISAE